MAGRGRLAKLPSMTAEQQKVLVTYATAAGSTAGVAARIAQVLRDAGLHVTLQRADEALDVDGFDAVVLGSPVYNQRWLPEIDELVRRAGAALARRPVWLFSVATFGDGRRVLGRLMRREPRNIAAIQETVRPREYRVFAGVIKRSQWPRLSRLLFHAFGGRLGDHRDWPAIDAWARTIAAALAR